MVFHFNSQMIDITNLRILAVSAEPAWAWAEQQAALVQCFHLSRNSGNFGKFQLFPGKVRERKKFQEIPGNLIIFTINKKWEKMKERERKRGEIWHYFLNITSKYITKLDFWIKKFKFLLARFARSQPKEKICPGRHVWPPQNFQLITPLVLYVAPRRF